MQAASLACKGSALWQYLLISVVGNTVASCCQNKKDKDDAEKPNVAGACCGYLITLVLGSWGMTECYSFAQPDKGAECGSLRETRLWTISAVCAWVQLSSSFLPCLVACCIAAAVRMGHAADHELPARSSRF